MNQFVRYLVVGGLNTAVCYVIYLLLLDFTGHNIAFTIDYLFGIVFSYFLQLKFVFQAEGSIKKFVKFPGVYVIQYLIGLVALNVVIDKFGVAEEFALIFAIIVPIPVVYLLSRSILKGSPS